MIQISVLILTKNEEIDLPGCLKSVDWSDDIHVLDSGSDDSTLSIAKAAGAHITTKPFNGYASQRNAGLALPFKYEWILVLDADERVPELLALEMGRFVVSVQDNVSAARIRRRDIWWGRWLKHAQISPFYEPAMIGAKMMLEGKWKAAGVWNMEQMDPDPFMADMNKYGLPWKVIEEPGFNLV